MAKLEKIDVPDSARQPKCWFASYPEAIAAVPNIRGWIKAGNEPLLWRGHTHTAPPPGSLPVYLEEVDIPEARTKIGRLAACPCCTPETGKWAKKGKIAWFPDEGVIRIIGPDCFSAIDGGAHSAALVEMRRQREIRLNEAFLLSNLPSVHAAVVVAEELVETARAWDQLRTAIIDRLGLANIDLWRHIGRGVLMVRESRQEVLRSETGDLHTRTVFDHVVFSEIAGVGLFDPAPKNLELRMKQALAALRDVDFPEPENALRAMSDPDKSRAAKLMGRGLTGMARVQDMMALLMPGLSKATINTLKNWGQQPNAPVKFYIDVEPNRMHLGTSPVETLGVSIPSVLWERMPKLPRFVARLQTAA